MKIISLLTYFIVLAVSFTATCRADSNTEPAMSAPVGISAQAYALIDADTGELLYGKNEHLRLGMASTTKIMTAIVAIESCDVETSVCISEKAVGIEGSSIYLKKNEVLSLKELIYALLLESANDAACAIAIAVSGNVPEFVDKMNEKAKELGLSDTHFSNPHGLSDPEHYTTAYDLSHLMAYCMRNEQFAMITGTKKLSLAGSDSSYSRLLVNHNKLLSENGICGGKTGFTKKTGRCLVTYGTNGTSRLCVATLNAPSDWADHRQLYTLGYSLYKQQTLEQSGILSETAHVCGGVGDNEISLYLTQPITLTLRDGVRLTRSVEMKRFYYAPIKKGDVLGRICYYNGDILVYSCNIESLEDIEKKEYERSFFKRIFGLD